ncbi:hypothetical protein AYJ08_05745 [Brevibacillus sp. SKDU10]|uniref:hypothetical protein n=1 Tax=Brevibacillus sp. SKDU10 TaxID=1247872 RepID=UPI0007C94D45|nr:hypothetical protein [Brevibacillus sp. SKDU10]OAJ75120.1 hypothetical protein AYJ08_05745 [Brevibacillus sp. SKDU10]
MKMPFKTFLFTTALFSLFATTAYAYEVVGERKEYAERVINEKCERVSDPYKGRIYQEIEGYYKVYEIRKDGSRTWEAYIGEKYANFFVKPTDKVCDL